MCYDHKLKEKGSEVNVKVNATVIGHIEQFQSC